MARISQVLFAIAGLLTAMHAVAEVTLYEHDGFRGRTLRADRSVSNLERLGFNDRASSAVVRGSSWEVCEDARFQGRCVVLRPGRYSSLREMGLNDRISSVRQAPRGQERAGRGYDDRTTVRGSEPGNEAGMGGRR